MKVLMVSIALMLTGCGTYAPCRYDGKHVSQHDANKMKRQGMNVECPGDEPKARTDSERFGRQLEAQDNEAVMAYPTACGADDCGKSPK